jgi:two-component system, OmpR family, sensor kinase
MWFRATDAQQAGEARGHSLRRRLLALVLAAVAVGSAVQAATAYRSALRNADAMLDSQLQVLARSIESTQPGAVRGYGVQVWGADGTLLFEGGAVQLPPRATLGFSDEVVDGARLRIYTLQTPQRTVSIAQDLGERQAQARRMAVLEALPSVATGLLLLLAVWLVIDRSLAPIERLRRQVTARAANELAPLPEAGLPREVQPLVQDLNLLFARVKEAFALQRQFVSDAAHELRSPLAALKLQVAALRRNAADAQQGAAAARLEEGIDRAVVLVTQLLALAREDVPVAAEAQAVDLDALCREAVADVLPLATARRIDLGLEPGPQGLQVRGEPAALRTLLRNLLDNAVKFTPPGGRVDVSLLQEQGCTVLRVEDSGPGIPEADRARVFDRFYRGPAAEGVPGSGLGLSIVQAIAARHGASVRLHGSQRLGGLCAEIAFAPEADREPTSGP